MGDRRSKSNKGSVVVRDRKGRLSLIWTWSLELGGNGKRFEVATGLDATRVNESIAQLQARQIEHDLKNRLFDPTLAKYRGERAVEDLAIGDLLDRFIKAKTPHVYKDTLGKYRALKTSLGQYFKAKKCEAVGEAAAIGFRDWLGNVTDDRPALAPETIKDKLVLAAAAWDWAIAEGLLKINPWDKVKRSYKIPPKQQAEPFTVDEIRAIIAAFRSDRWYSHYADYVEFLIGIGCRTGEASALRWEHVAEDCGSVWIGESVTVNRDRKATKGNKARSVQMSPRLQKMLLARCPENVAAEMPVFPSPKGVPINTRNFSRRAWHHILEGLGIDYARPYTSRHANATISIKVKGENPEMVAQRLGNSPRTLAKRYIGVVKGETPDIFD
jgi:integrase